MRLLLQSSLCGLLFLLINLTPKTSTGQSLDWVVQAGSTGWDRANAVAIDQNNHVYSIGMFRGTVDFDPGDDVYELNSVGEEDVFITKYDQNGNLLWALQYGNGMYVECNALAVDDEHIYIAGSFLGNVDFDASLDTTSLQSTGGDRDAYILKLDLDGNFVWAKQFSGVYPSILYSCPTEALAIAVDQTGNIVITGYFDGIVDFETDPESEYLLTTVMASDIYVCKLSSEGQLIWVSQIGGTQGGVGYDIAVDEANNIYSTGTIGGTYDFDPGEGEFELSISDQVNSEYYLLKLNEMGAFEWAKVMGPGTGNAIEIDSEGHVFTSGWFPPGYSALLHKLDASGNIIWSKDIVGPSTNALTLDSEGNVYTAGYSWETNDFDPGAGTFELSGEGGYIRKLTSAGDFQWAVLLEAETSQIEIENLAIDSQNKLYTVGFFDGLVDFDPSDESYPLETPPLSYNFFIHKMTTISETVGMDEQKFDGDFYVFPNPSSDDRVSLRFDKPQRFLEISVRNVLGQLVSSQVVRNSAQFELVLGQSPGMYFLEVYNPASETRAVVRVVRE